MHPQPSHRRTHAAESHIKSVKPVRGTRIASVLACACAVAGLPVHAAQVCALPGSAGNATISGTVNTYYAVQAGSYGPSSSSIALDAGSQQGAAAIMQPGDLALVIQMQCANINSSNSTSYGDGVAGEPANGYTDPGVCVAGRHEFVRAGAATTSSSLDLAGSPLASGYVQAAATAATGRRSMQVVRVPQYLTATVAGTVTAAPWNGRSGGIVVLDVANTLTLSGGINVDGMGFRGGGGRSRSQNDAQERFISSSDLVHATKGEGIAGTPRYVSEKRDVSSGLAATITDLGTGWGGYPNGTASTGDFARGAPGTAGGGGAFWDATSDNGGGGGGGNGGAGGRGAAGWRSGGYAGINSTYSNLPEKKWGFGGSAFLAPAIGRLVLGGGGGAGDNNTNSSPGASAGAAGGGIVMVRAGTLAGSGVVSARGARAPDNPSNDGTGGGGAGGSVVMVATTWSGSPSVDVSGGRGGDAWVNGDSAHGNGGGGGGGVVIRSGPAVSVVAGGANGLTNTVQGQPGGAAHGAAAGNAGINQLIPASGDTVGTHVGRTCKSDLWITKSNTPGINGEVDQTSDTVTKGATTTYTITVHNDGPMTAVDAMLTDTTTGLQNCAYVSGSLQTTGTVMPPATSALTYANLSGTGVKIPSMASGSTLSFRIQCEVP